MDLTLDYLPRLPGRKDFRIGCVGAGFIMRDCHLVAYRQAGFNPVAIASRDPAHARAVAETRGIPHCHETVAELLADESVEVLDVAVPPAVQPAILRAALEHAGHLRGVLASSRPDPRTRFPHRDGINLYILEYDNGCRASAWDDVWTGPAREGAASDIAIRWRVEGTEGLARGTIGWPSYPARTPSTLDV